MSDWPWRYRLIAFAYVASMGVVAFGSMFLILWFGS